MGEPRVIVKVRVSPDAKAYAERVATEEGRSLSDVMRRLMAAGVRLHQEQRSL